MDLSRQVPNPPRIFVLTYGMALVAKRLKHIATSDPTTVRVISDNAHYPAYEAAADDVRVVGRIR